MSINSTQQRMHWFMIVVFLFSLVCGSFVVTQTSAKAQSATVPGQWVIVPANAPTHTQLTTIAAVSSNSVWVAGMTTINGYGVIVLEHWNGSSWSSSTPFPHQSQTSHQPMPTGFAVINSSNIWMAGGQQYPSTEAFIAHWDGTSWQQVETPDTGGSFPRLESITALSATNIWAFGATNGGDTPLIEHWDGSNWKILDIQQELQNVGLGGLDLWGSCVTTDDNILIQGSTSGADWFIKTNGTTWSISAVGFFSDFVCTSPKGIWTINTPPLGTNAPLSHYDGNAWTTMPADQTSGYFNGLTAISATDLWVIGVDQSYQNSTTLIKHWDGTQLTAISSPNVSGSTNVLSAVSAVNTNDVWTVGYSYASLEISSALIEHYTYTPPIKPGGTWITKTGYTVAVGKIFTFQASAYSTHSGDPAIARVNFTATWPGHGWVDICGNVTAHTAQNVYSCSTDFTKLNGNIPIPEGSITVTFNVTDKNDNVNNAPNGSLSGKISTPLLNVPFASQYQGQAFRNADCGPTSVAMTLKFYNRGPGLDANALVAIRNATGNTNTQQPDTTIPQLVKALNFYGAKTTLDTGTIDNQVSSILTALQQKHPTIVLVHGATLGRGDAYGDHFLVLVGTSHDGKTVYVNDPDDQAARSSGWIVGGKDIPLSVTLFKKAIQDSQSGAHGITVS